MRTSAARSVDSYLRLIHAAAIRLYESRVSRFRLGTRSITVHLHRHGAMHKKLAPKVQAIDGIGKTRLRRSATIRRLTLCSSGESLREERACLDQLR